MPRRPPACPIGPPRPVPVSPARLTAWWLRRAQSAPRSTSRSAGRGARAISKTSTWSLPTSCKAMRLPYSIRRSRGFSLVELMVAVVVGMVAVIFAMRLLVTSEQQKSAAVGGSDTMQNGMLAMFQINTDAAQAGWGINDALVNGCDTRMQDTDGFQLAQATRNGVTVTPLAPVIIQSNPNRSD